MKPQINIEGDSPAVRMVVDNLVHLGMEVTPDAHITVGIVQEDFESGIDVVGVSTDNNEWAVRFTTAFRDVAGLSILLSPGGGERQIVVAHAPGDMRWRHAGLVVQTAIANWAWPKTVTQPKTGIIDRLFGRTRKDTYA